MEKQADKAVVKVDNQSTFSNDSWDRNYCQNIIKNNKEWIGNIETSKQMNMYIYRCMYEGG